MPIHARYRWFYPIDWPRLSAVIRFRRPFIQRRPECRREIGAVRRLSNGRTAELVGVAPAQGSDLGRPNESLSRHAERPRWAALIILSC